MSSQADISKPSLDKPLLNKPLLNKPDLRTDGEKFQDAMRSILAAPKKEVMQALEAEKAARKKQRMVKKR